MYLENSLALACPGCAVGKDGGSEAPVGTAQDTGLPGVALIKSESDRRRGSGNM